MEHWDLSTLADQPGSQEEKKKLEISPKMKMPFWGAIKWSDCRLRKACMTWILVHPKPGAVPNDPLLTFCRRKLSFSTNLIHGTFCSSSAISSDESYTLRLEGILEDHSGQWDGGVLGGKNSRLRKFSSSGGRNHYLPPREENTPTPCC